MKRVIALLLVLVLVVGLAGCSKGKEVEINIDNWDDYFKMEQTIEDFKYEEGFYGVINSAKAKLNIRIYPKSDFEVKDVSFNLSLTTNGGLFRDDDKWESYDNVDFVSITEDGHYENSFNVSLKKDEVLSMASLEEPYYVIQLNDLKGSIIVNEE